MNENIDDIPTKAIDDINAKLLDLEIDLINGNIVIIEEDGPDDHDNYQRRPKYIIHRENLIPIYDRDTLAGYYYIDIANDDVSKILKGD